MHVQELPAELLAAIFISCTPEDPLTIRQPHTTTAPMILCQICSRWREIALGTPELWTYLYFIPHVTTHRKRANGWPVFEIRPSEAEFLEWWTTNLQSSQVVFRLNIVQDTQKRTTEIEQHVDLDHTLFRHLISTSRGLSLSGFGLFGLRCTFSRHALECPNLESLAIFPLSQPFLERIPILPSPNLRRLFCETLKVARNESIEDQLPFQSLTHISIENLFIKTRDWLRFIRCLEMLKFGSFAFREDPQLRDKTPFDPASLDLPVKQLPYVRELNIRSSIRPSTFNPLFQLDLPALKTLRFRGNFSTDKALQGMLQSCPNVQILHLRRQYVDDDNPDSAVALNETWKQATDLEVMIIDGPDDCVGAPAQDWMLRLGDSGSTWFDFSKPPPMLRRLELVHVSSDTVMPDASQLHDWVISLPMEVVFREERDWNYWTLTPAQLRGWMETQ